MDRLFQALLLGQGWASRGQRLGQGTVFPGAATLPRTMYSHGALNLKRLRSFPRHCCGQAGLRAASRPRPCPSCGESWASGQRELPGRLGAALPQGVVGTGQLKGLGVGQPLDVRLGLVPLGMESGQGTHCPTVTFTSLPGRWGVPPPGAFSERVLVFTVAEFCVNRIFKVTLALQPRSRCFEDYQWWVQRHPGVSLWWHSPAKPCSFSPGCKARTQLFQTARAGGGPGCLWPTPYLASGQKPRGWRVGC